MPTPEAADGASWSRAASPATGVWSLGLAQALALAAAVGAGLCYARWLEPAAFAQWAIALAAARASQLLLDGGLKTALVRHAGPLEHTLLRRLTRWSALLAAALTLSVAALAWIAWTSERLSADAALLLALYPASYLLTYPWLFTALARLERSGRFGSVGRAESASLALEFLAPALLMALGLPWWAAFAAAAVAARALRSAWIVHAARVAETATAPLAEAAGAAGVLKAGAGLQAVAGVSMLRDQSPLWMLAPAFGSAWAGAYTLAGTAGALLCQVGTQTAARVSLPAWCAMDPAQRWPAVLAQTRRLAIATLPLLALAPAWLAQVDAHWWHGRWSDAVALMPWVAARMVAGIATSTVGTWLVAARDPWAVARVHARWTAVELVAAAAALFGFGPLGLAVAGAVTPWLGLRWFLAAAEPGVAAGPRLCQLAAALLLRPSAWTASVLGAAAWVTRDPALLWAATAALPLCWLTESGHWRQRRGPGRVPAASADAPGT